ncbi:hypothetical protein KEP70_19695 [Escherichia coli]|uniref:hypothetical protein n=1 Tax=Escherichia coli TaxID=562 RepID=UPI000A19F825|nr:hypothetical protein [Escherichia coli]MBB9841286.1 hypothetical protein [Escherichia coli]MBS9328546.1 hypothetical protein [Escherichia coli]
MATMTQVYLAFYKGRAEHHGFARLSDWLTRTITRGEYSHCELAVDLGSDEYRCYSSSVRDDGVRCKVMPLPVKNWDLVPVEIPEALVDEFFNCRKGMPYDWFGAIGFVVLSRGRTEKYFCSEFCAECLGLTDPWRYSPNMLSAIALSAPSVFHYASEIHG